MKTWPTKPVGVFVEERTERISSNSATIYSVTNEKGFVRSLDLFDKQVFSADTSNYKRVKFHDLAYNPSRINVGSVALCEDANGGAVSPMYVIVRCNSGMLPRYLLQFLKSQTGLRQIRYRCEGAVRFQLKFRDLCAIPVPAPPLPEQKRIVKLLDEADQLRKLRAEADKRIAELIPALFDEMFGEGTEPKFRHVRLGEVADVVSGVTKGRRFNGRIPVEVPYLRVANVQAGYLDLREVKTIHALPEEIKDLKLKKGDVLLTEGGDFDKLGRGALLEVDLPDCIHQNHVFRVRTHQTHLSPVYFSSFLQTSHARAYFLACAKRTTNLASINMRQLRALPVPIPPLSLQESLAGRLGEVRAMEAQQAINREQLDKFLQSILDRAFRGEL